MFRMKKAFLFLSAAVLCAGSAWGLDANEIAQLVRSGVQDTVIINMVQGQKLDRPLTAQDVLNLNAAGASGTLLEYVTRPEAISSSYVAAQPAPVYVESPPIQVQQPTTVVTTQPNVVVAAPPTVYYGSGYYNPSYVYPYRYYPNYSFNFGFGSSRGWDRGHRYRPGRPSGRPHGPPPGRPGGRPGGRPPRR